MDTNELLGVWKLQSVDGQDPSTISIAEHFLGVRSDGTVEFTSKLSEPFAGMTLNGSGTWTQDGDIVSWSIGEQQTDTHIALRSGVLAIDRDPVLLAQGTTPVSTEYSR